MFLTCNSIKNSVDNFFSSVIGFHIFRHVARILFGYFVIDFLICIQKKKKRIWHSTSPWTLIHSKIPSKNKYSVYFLVDWNTRFGIEAHSLYRVYSLSPPVLFDIFLICLRAISTRQNLHIHVFEIMSEVDIFNEDSVAAYN